MENSAGRHADQHRDGVLELGARDARVGRLCNRRVELRLRGRHVLVGVEALLEQGARDGEHRGVIGDGRVQNAPLLVRDAQLEIVLRERTLRAEQGVGERRRARLRREAIRGDGIADAAPKIDLVGGLERQGENVVRRRRRRLRRCRPGGRAVVVSFPCSCRCCRRRCRPAPRSFSRGSRSAPG